LGTFLPIPTDVLASENFRALSLKAKALVLDIGARFNGFNNGDLSAAWALMQLRGWRSKDTLSKALKELVSAGMIEQTRQGGLNGTSLYAFTWRPIDECKGKMDVSPSRVASGKWKSSGQPVTTLSKTPIPVRPSGETGTTVGLEPQKRASK
jgi:hypothetical protein